MKWDIRPGAGCGPLCFGMSRAAVAEVLGPPEEVRERNGILAEARAEARGWWYADFRDDHLIRLNGWPDALAGVVLGGRPIAGRSVTAFIKDLCGLGGEIGQAQGGSLYWPGLCLALLQFEMPGARSFLLWARGEPLNEPLAPITAGIALDYYQQQEDRAPERDLLGIFDKLDIETQN